VDIFGGRPTNSQHAQSACLAAVSHQLEVYTRRRRCGAALYQRSADLTACISGLASKQMMSMACVLAWRRVVSPMKL